MLIGYCSKRVNTNICLRLDFFCIRGFKSKKVWMSDQCLTQLPTKIASLNVAISRCACTHSHKLTASVIREET